MYLNLVDTTKIEEEDQVYGTKIILSFQQRQFLRFLESQILLGVLNTYLAVLRPAQTELSIQDPHPTCKPLR